MTGTRPLVQAGYTVAALLAVIPIADAILAILSPTVPHPDDARWRFMAIGNFGNVLLLPLFALFIALACAHVAASPRAQRFIGIVSAALALVIAGLLVVFVVDFFRLRPTFPAQVQHAAAVATSNAVVKYLLNLLGAAGLAFAGFARSRRVVVAAQAIPDTAPERRVVG